MTKSRNAMVPIPPHHANCAAPLLETPEFTMSRKTSSMTKQAAAKHTDPMKFRMRPFLDGVYALSGEPNRCSSTAAKANTGITCAKTAAVSCVIVSNMPLSLSAVA